MTHQDEMQHMRLSEELLNAHITLMGFTKPDIEGETLRATGLLKSAHYSAI